MKSLRRDAGNHTPEAYAPRSSLHRSGLEPGFPARRKKLAISRSQDVARPPGWGVRPVCGRSCRPGGDGVGTPALRKNSRRASRSDWPLPRPSFRPASEGGAEATALQTLPRWPDVLELRAAFGLRRVHRRFLPDCGCVILDQPQQAEISSHLEFSTRCFRSIRCDWSATQSRSREKSDAERSSRFRRSFLRVDTAGQERKENLASLRESQNPIFFDADLECWA